VDYRERERGKTGFLIVFFLLGESCGCYQRRTLAADLLRTLYGKGDFEATFRACAYAASPVVCCDARRRYPAVLYSGYLVIIGLQRAQGFDR